MIDYPSPPPPDLTGNQTITSFLGSNLNCFQFHFFIKWDLRFFLTDTRRFTTLQSTKVPCKVVYISESTERYAKCPTFVRRKVRKAKAVLNDGR